MLGCYSIFVSVSVCLFCMSWSASTLCVLSFLFCISLLFPFFFFFPSVFLSVYLHFQTVWTEYPVALQVTQSVRTHVPVPMPKHVTDPDCVPRLDSRRETFDLSFLVQLDVTGHSHPFL